MKNLYRIIGIMLILIILVACNKTTQVEEETIDEINLIEQKKVKEKKLKTTSATKYINYVDSKYTKFWKAIDNNYIDAEYNKVKVDKNNIRIVSKANKQYASNWIKELKYTYDELMNFISEKDKKDLKNQYDYFMKYYEATEKIYTYILDIDDEYKSKVEGKYKTRQFYALANEARKYTVTLKEYIYLLSGKVEIYYINDIDKKDRIKIKDTYNQIKNSKEDIELQITIDDKYEDILKDKYNNKKIANIEGKKYKKAKSDTSKWKKYWKDEIENIYDILYKELKGEHKDILKEQYNAYMSYVDKRITIQNRILKDCNRYKKLYKKDVKVENNIFRGRAYKDYSILLDEYYYTLTNKIRF